jgi:tRNA(fMet)-specific endonuclease VapC
VRLVVDTGVFSAALSKRRRPALDAHVTSLRGHQLFLSVATVTEVRFGALVAEWGTTRRERLEGAIATTTVIPVTDELLTGIAETRAACRRLGHPLADPAHTNDLWIAATALCIGAELVSADRIFREVPGLTLHPSRV